MNMVLGRSGALHRIDEVRAAAEADDGRGVLLRVADKLLGAEIPYVFGVSRVFDLDGDGRPILPVKFRRDERLRKALGLFYPKELYAVEREKTRLLENDCVVEFLFGELRARPSGADDIDLRTVPTIRAQGEEDEFWLGTPEKADYVMVRVEGGVRSFGDMIGFALARDKQIVGSEVVTYFVLSTCALENWPESVPVGGECYTNVDERYCAITEELLNAKVAHEKMIEAELVAKKH